MKMEYNLTQVQDVATFLWNNNPYVKSWPSAPKDVLDVVNQILSHARRQGKLNMTSSNWVSTIGTGGYTIIFSSDTPDLFDIQVLVDMSVGTEARWVEEYIDENT